MIKVGISKNFNERKNNMKAHIDAKSIRSLM